MLLTGASVAVAAIDALCTMYDAFINLLCVLGSFSVIRDSTGAIIKWNFALEKHTGEHQHTHSHTQWVTTVNGNS